MREREGRDREGGERGGVRERKREGERGGREGGREGEGRRRRRRGCADLTRGFQPEQHAKCISRMDLL